MINMPTTIQGYALSISRTCTQTSLQENSLTPQNLEKCGCGQFGKLSEGDRNAEVFWPGGCGIVSSSKESFSEPLVKDSLLFPSNELRN
jgi:hypothetical protein